jgi:hypothetical protein
MKYAIIGVEGPHDQAFVEKISWFSIESGTRLCL